MLNVKLVTFKGYTKPGGNYIFYTINTRLNLLYTCIDILLLNSLFMFVFGGSCLCFYFNYCYMTHTLLLLPWENGSLFRKWLPKIYKKSTWTKRNQFMKIKHIWYLPFWLILEVFVVNFKFCFNEKDPQTYH